jgi:ABC-type polysaccharide/polyol phosphate export permease
MILIGATLAYYTSLVRGIAGFIIISFGLLYHYKKQPFINPVHNSLETLSNFACMTTIYCGMFFTNDVKDSGLGRTMLVVIVFIVNVIFYIAWLIAFIGFFKKRYKKEHMQVVSRPFMSVKTIEVMTDKHEPLKFTSRSSDDEEIEKPLKQMPRRRRQSMKDMITNDLFNKKVIIYDG